MNTVLLVDGNALLYRAYHAFPKGLSTPAGEPINAVYGFTRILLGAIKTLKPTSIAVCFDLPGPTFRHDSYPQYKANRPKMPEELVTQISRTHQLVENLEFPIYTAPGYEADDVMGTLATQIAKEDSQAKIVILTGDQDIIQLVSNQIQVYSPASYPKSPVRYTPEEVKQKYGFEPRQMIDYKALRGDPSDNIPGVPGVGEVTAKSLIQKYRNIDNLYQAIKEGKTAEIKPTVLEKLKKFEESALVSRDLATIQTDLPISFDAKKGRLQLKDPDRLIALFEELGFKSLMKELPISHSLLSEAADIFSLSPLEKKKALKIKESSSQKIDRQLAPVLRAMEARGVKIDLAYLKGLEKEFTRELAKIKQQIFDLAGQEFNPDSPSQVSHILYQVLSIPTKNIRQGKNGFSTDAGVLRELATEFPIAQLLLQYRELMKLLSTYIRPLPELADSHHRIHTSYAPDTATGRISSRDPNLQNIPIRSEQGRRIRKAFIAGPGMRLVGADYSQMELRIAAHLSGDPAMLAVFRQGGDFHSQTAEKMGVDRRVAKIINFSILYGKGAFGFAKDLGVTMAEAKEYIEQYFQTYQKLRQYLDHNLALAKKQGYLETMFGRRRSFPEINSSNFQARSGAEREAYNHPIQGSQADILKIAMANLATKLKGTPIQLILTVHDELVVEAPISEVSKAARLLKEAMQGAAHLSIPIEVHLKAGPNWTDLKEITENKGGEEDKES